MDRSGFLHPALKYRGPRELRISAGLIAVSSPVTGPFPMGLWQTKVVSLLDKIVSGLDNHCHSVLFFCLLFCFVLS